MKTQDSFATTSCPNTLAGRLRTICAAGLLPLLLLLPAMVQAQDYTYITNNGTITITGYTGSNGVVMIPGTIADLPVASIGDWAFYATSITNVLIPDSVINIGDGAFFDCESLTNVTLGSSVTDIGDWPFAFCPSLTSVCDRGNAPNLGGDNVFYGNLATVYYLSGATGWGPMFDGHPTVLWNPPGPFNYTTNNGMITITGYNGSGGVVTIPGSINFLPVTSIGGWAFSYCGLTSVTIPNSVTSIGDSAFSGCESLTNIAIPNRVTNIGNTAFYWCTSLTSVTIGTNVTSIGNYAFQYCADLTSITIPNSVTNIGDVAFNWCTSLIAITVDTLNPVYSSVNGVLFNKSQTTLIQCPAGKGGSYTVPNSVNYVGDDAFYNCTNLIGIYFQGNAPNIGNEVFGHGENVAFNAIVYYLPGTTGWGTFAQLTGRPTALWYLPNPLILNNGTSFGVQTNGFGFIISWATNLSVVVEACTNLANPIWSPVGTNTLTGGSSYFSDCQWTNYPVRCYRLRLP
jgi:hypothetical protein